MKIKFSTIGSGTIAEKMIRGGFLSDNFELYGVYSRTKERAEEFAKKFKAENVFTDLNSLASSDTDAVYIASPTSLHFQQSKIMLSNKKHVLCEKPACSNSEELKELLEIADKNNVVYLEAMRPVYSPGYEWITKNLHKIGKIRHAVFSFCKYSSRYDNFKKGIVENAFKSELSNGSLMDIGVYPLHFMISLFGSPDFVTSSAFKFKDSIDGCGSAILTYKDFIGVINYSKITNSKLPCEIQGEEGTMIFSPVSTPVEAKIIYRNGETEKAEIPFLEWDLYYEIQAFCEMIMGKRSAKQYNIWTEQTIKASDEIRKQCNIVFPSDK